MAAEYPVTTGVRHLRDRKIAFTPHSYPFEEHGGTRHSAAMLGVSEHSVVKTLVFLADQKEPFLVLMHGDREVSAKELARTIGAKRAEPCDERTAQRYTGYQFGGTSPFGTRSALPVYVERSIFGLPHIYINGGKRGFLVAIDPADLRKAFPLTEVSVAITAG
jgi:Cys-tRNA(Pro) deacylase